jgi:hypothetical protein
MPTPAASRLAEHLTGSPSPTEPMPEQSAGTRVAEAVKETYNQALKSLTPS